MRRDKLPLTEFSGAATLQEEYREIRRFLVVCHPLNDPVRFFALGIGWILLAFIIYSYLPLVISPPAGVGIKWIFGIIAGGVIPAFIMFLSLRPLMVMGRKPKVLFLRAFSRDIAATKDDRLRYRLRNCLPRRFSLGGIRAPRHRVPFWLRCFGEGFTAMLYLGSNRFELEADDRDWFARLLASAARAHAIIIDLRTLTPYVHNEIELTLALVEEQGRFFCLIDRSKSRDEWLALLSMASGLPVCANQERSVEFLDSEDILSGGKEALWHCHQVLSSIPDKPMTVTPAAYHKMKSLVPEKYWATSFWSRSLGLWILMFLAASPIGWLITFFLFRFAPGWILGVSLVFLGAMVVIYLVYAKRVICGAWIQRSIGIRPMPGFASVIITFSLFFLYFLGLPLLALWFLSESKAARELHNPEIIRLEKQINELKMEQINLELEKQKIYHENFYQQGSK